RDVLPPGFAYVPGSSYVYPAGASRRAPPVQAPDPAGGATLYWQLASAADPIPAGGVRSLTYQVMVTPRAAEGVIRTNTAQGFAAGDGGGRFARAGARRRPADGRVRPGRRSRGTSGRAGDARRVFPAGPRRGQSVPGRGRRRAAKRRRAALLIGLGVALVAAVIFLADGFTGLELKRLDARFRLRGERRAPADVVIVAIDDASFRELQLQWPWPRAVHADLVDALAEMGAS